MEEKYQQLLGLIGEISDLQSTLALLGWDMQVNMAPGGAEDRSDAQSTLSRIAHLKITSSEIGQLLEDLKPYQEQLDPDSDEFQILRVCRREYEKRTKVPPQWIAEFSRQTTLAQSIWEKAKHESNFAIFQPQLEKIVDLRREYVSYFQPFDHIYDPLLDDFEPGMKTAEVKAIFDALRPAQVTLIKAIRDKPQVESKFLTLNYPEKDQWDFGIEVISRFGYDWNHGRQDKSVHPFTQSMGIGDVRITTRVDPRLLNTALFGTMHECGHALYEQGVDLKYRRTPLASGASMAIHESQSRMWENLVGRSWSFWKYFYPKFQKMFPAQVGDVSLSDFYKGINKVAPSFIRVEADEATYNLHIMLRLELEIALMEGSLEVKDLPEAWNSRVQEYLGITPPNDSLGVLQDVHWSGGMFGYFPTYALGNLVSVQLWQAIHQDIPNLEQQFERGEFHELLSWLRKNVHRSGAKYEPQILVKKITGSTINPQPYIQYLTSKFSQIYGL